MLWIYHVLNDLFRICIFAVVFMMVLASNGFFRFYLAATEFQRCMIVWDMIIATHYGTPGSVGFENHCSIEIAPMKQVFDEWYAAGSSTEP